MERFATKQADFVIFVAQVCGFFYYSQFSITLSITQQNILFNAFFVCGQIYYYTITTPSAFRQCLLIILVRGTVKWGSLFQKSVMGLALITHSDIIRRGLIDGPLLPCNIVIKTIFFIPHQFQSFSNQ